MSSIEEQLKVAEARQPAEPQATFKQYDELPNKRKERAASDLLRNRSKSKKKKSRFVSGLADFLQYAGVLFAFSSFGLFFIIINGAFSVIGLEALCRLFGPSGDLAWGVLSAWKFEFFGMRPVLPWAGVLAATVLQIAVSIKLANNDAVGLGVLIAVGFLSAYDFGTTYFGIGTLSWIKDLQAIGIAFQIVFGAILTFAFEYAVGQVIHKARPPQWAETWIKNTRNVDE